jgi:uncharacterized protein (DUF488 family)
LIEKILTIGVYGYSEPEFSAALTRAQVDTLGDVRQRRGVRGADYAFANHRRLEALLISFGINYLHLPQLAPTPTLRSIQKAADKSAAEKKRDRTGLSPAFIAGYRHDILALYSTSTFLSAVGSEAKVVAILCVERLPASCHRGIVGEELSTRLRVPLEHLTP